MKHVTKNLIALLIFSIAMAALESAVVVYLRALYYPDGFTVALKLIDQQIVLIEIVREASTVIMIGAIAYLVGRTSQHRFAYFLLCFAVWDIFYYVWLKVFIDWPASFFEWDILFLIPITWLGPVLSPIICSVTMIILAFALLRSRHEIKISNASKGLLAGGCLLILYTYMYDYGNLLIKNELLPYYTNLLENKKFFELASAYTPTSYKWGIYWIGEILICIVIFKLFRSKTLNVHN